MIHLRIGPLVRATSTTSAVIWAKLSHACNITLNAIPYDASEDEKATSTVSVSMRTVTVGGHHYAAPQLQGLQPGTWYRYYLSTSSIAADHVDKAESIEQSFLQCFRTMNASISEASQEKTPPPSEAFSLRLAYGSCRKYIMPETDALSAFGRWLRNHLDERETMWPHLLLLIGDQIYADQPLDEFVQMHPHLHDGAVTFEDFALIYEYIWTSDTDVRQVFAVMPTYMIFDDHDVINNWNISPQWRASMLQHGQEQVLVDGLIAYWVYQGWGNLVSREQTDHPLLTIMQEAEQSGEDALERLRTYIKREVYRKSDGHWHYTIPTTPPIFVVNARTERTTVFTDYPDDIYGPTRIMSQSQMAELEEWMQRHDTSLSLLVSSVPVLLPPLIGLAEYLMGIRLWQPGLRWLGLRLAHIQQRFALRISFDHWPVYSQTWHELIHSLTRRTHDVLVLSGDVHFSYAMEAHRSFFKNTKARLIQFVSTPLQNVLGRKSEQMIVGQASITRSIYGGLHTRMLPLYEANEKRRLQHDILLRNTLAYVTLQPDDKNDYIVEQEYLGVVDGQMQVVGRTKLSYR